MCMLLIMAMLTVAALPGQSYPPPDTAWKVSAVTLVSSRIADVVSTEMSKGVEVNPLIPVRQNRKPQVWVYGATIGLGVAIVLAQRVAVRRLPPHSRWRRAFTVVNLSVGGAGWGVAAHNWNVK